MSTKVSTDLINLSGNTGGLIWAKGTTAQQPASATAGEMRVDTTTHTTLVYNGTEWKTLKETAFVVPPIPTHFLVIAGGGGGGPGYQAGGGGAGGLRTSYGTTTGGGGSAESTTGISLNTAYTITVGAGGAGGTAINSVSSAAKGFNGNDSIFSTITSTGGGGGASYWAAANAFGKDGGSGGGAGNFTPPLAGGAATSPTQGYAGGSVAIQASPEFAGSGGGGAGGLGESITSGSLLGDGGLGLAVSITGSSVTYAGGGGAGNYGSGGPSSSGGSNIGGDGSPGQPSVGGAVSGASGVVNTGSGGGGTGGASLPGGNGSSGAVILRYPTADLPYFTTTGTLNTPSTTDTVADTAYPVANLAYYKLDSNANDSSGNSYNGTATNVTFVNGRFNEAAKFNGSSSKINLGTSSNFSITTTGALSISMWIKTTSTTTGYVISKADDSGDYEWSIEQLSNGTLTLYAYTSAGGVASTINNTAVINDGNWHNLVGVIVNNTSTTLYIDGIAATSTSFSGTAASTSTPTLIGHFGGIAAATAWFEGDIDQVRIFSSALAPGDVEDLYNEHFSTKFTDGSNTALKFTGGTGDITFSDTAPVFTPGDNFNTVLYTGNGGTQAISTVGFEPDLVWIKQRTLTESHSLFDTVRGVDLFLRSDTIAAENNFGGTYGVNSFNSNGFTVGNGSAVNGNGYSMVAWSWKAGGAARSNTDGTVTSQVSANVSAGFSIITSTSPAGAYTWGHGLSKAPELWIHKATNYTFGWETMYPDTFGQAAGSNNPSDWNRIFLNTSAATTTNTFYSATDTVLSNAGWGQVNNFVTYAWHSVAGYSKIGIYTGNGSTTGPIVTTGFESAWIMVKRTDNTSAWNIQDNKRNTTNPRTSVLQANSSDIEYTSSSYAIDFNATGFQIVNSDNGWNTSGGTYIYMTFAAT